MFLVKRILSIFFLALYLISFTELHQVLRLPLLVDHFNEHQAQVPDMSFIEFLVMHYETDVPHDATDMKLPFKDCGHSIVASPIAVTTQKISLSESFATPRQEFASAYQEFIPASYLNEIFQPPKA